MGIATATATATAGPRQLSDNNPNGTVLGASATDLVSLHNVTPVAQATDASQIAPVLGAQIGLVTTYSTQQSPSSVATITTAEKSFTVMGGTGFNVQLLTTDMVFCVNKPTAQAGLSMGNCYISGSNTLKIVFGNISAGTLTPTASQNYMIVAIRGFPTFTATLSPASVAASTTAEQTFTLAGLTAGQGIPAGYLLQVSKPTSQTGLDIVGCRVVASNQVGITFGNFTAAAITPTASEAYTFWALNGLDAHNNYLLAQMNVDTVGAIGAGVVISGGNTAFVGALATDTVVGIFKPTAQAAATNATLPVLCLPTADTLTIYFLSAGSGLTPTASEVYGINIFRNNPVAPLAMYTQSLAPTSVAASTSAEQTFTVTGLVAGTPVWVNKPTCTPGLGIGGVRVSGANTLAINYVNFTTVAIVPPTETYVIGNFQTKAPGVSAGNAAQSISQTAGASSYQRDALLRNIRSSLVAKGVILGS